MILLDYSYRGGGILINVEMEVSMKRNLLVMISILLILTAFISCDNKQKDPPVNAEEIAKDLDTAAIIKDVIDGADGVEVSYLLNQKKALDAGDYTLTMTVEFKEYESGAGKITGGKLIYTIDGKVTGTTFTATGTCSVKTDDKAPLVVAGTTVAITADNAKVTFTATATDTTSISIVGNPSITLTGGASVTVGNEDPIKIEAESTQEPEPEPEYYTVKAEGESKEISYSKLVADGLKLSEYDGMTAEEGVTLLVDTPIVLAKDFIFDSITLKGKGAGSDNAMETPIGIDLSESRNDIKITIHDSKISGFGYAICSNKAVGSVGADQENEKDPQEGYDESHVAGGSLTLIIENTDFSDCFKGLYATDIKDLKVTGGTFSNMGTDAVDTNYVTRSGSALDINQMSAGNSIVITGAKFENCGSDKGSTSGAIKIKVRGGEDDTNTDIPANAAGKFESVSVSGCTFGTADKANHYDVVLGTSEHESTADKDWDIQSGCNVAWKNEKATETVEPGDQTETTT